MKTTTQNIVGQSKSGMRMSGYGDTSVQKGFIY